MSDSPQSDINALEVPSQLITQYPEIDLWAVEPPIMGLHIPPFENIDSAEELEAARAYYALKGDNPFYPKNLAHKYNIRRHLPPFPPEYDLPTCSLPPAIPKLTHQASDIEFLKPLHLDGMKPVWRVQIHASQFVLKIYRNDVDDDFVHCRDIPDDPEAQMTRFKREYQAYAHLLHAGLCADGTVPMCYGWLDLNPKLSGFLKAYRNDARNPVGLLLEYIPDLRNLDYTTITLDNFHASLKAVNAIHRAHVWHHDLGGHNVFLRLDGHILILSFDFSRTSTAGQTGGIRWRNSPGIALNRLDLWLEFWTFCLHMRWFPIPDRRLREFTHVF